MLMLALFSWWYGAGWKQVAGSFLPRLRGVADGFSVSLLVPTLFAPWRRIITPPGRSLEDRFHAWIDNLFSRGVGFVVRGGVLLAASVSLLITAIITLVEIVLWPLVPLAVPGLIILGFSL